MGAMTAFLVKDDAATPVEHTLRPVTDNPHPTWRGAAAGVPFEGQHTVELTEETQRDGKIKRQQKLTVRVMETLGASGTSAGYVAPPKVAYEEIWYITNISSPRSTQADRANGLKMAIGLAQGASSTTATGVLDQASAGDAFKSSTLPVPAFLVNGEIPN